MVFRYDKYTKKNLQVVDTIAQSISGMNALILQAMGLNGTTAVLLRGWFWYQITHKGWYTIEQRKQIKTN